MAAYVVLTQEKTLDSNELEIYGREVQGTREGHPFTSLAHYGELTVLEGEPFEGSVILQFPDTAQAKAWYESPAYQAALTHRKAGAHCRVFIIEGRPGISV